MGNQPSSQVSGAGPDDDSVSVSSLADNDQGYDGLPPDASAAADFQVIFSQPVDGLPVFSPPPRQPQPPPAASASPAQPAKKSKKSRKSNSRRSSNENYDGDQDAETGSHDAAADDLEALARNLKSEPESPEATRTKKKKRRKSKDKTQSSPQTQSQPLPDPESLDPIEDDLPAIPEVAEAPEEAAALPTADLPAESAAPEVESQSPNSRRKRKKNKSKADKANGSRLDLNEDPITGSDDEVVIPSSDRPSRSKKSHHDGDGSSRKFKKKNSIPAVTEMDASAIEDVAKDEPRADVVGSTQQDALAGVGGPSDSNTATIPAPAPNAFLRRSNERDPYEIGDDYSSPLVTRKERRSRLAPTLAASASLAQAVSAELVPADTSNGLSGSQIQNGAPESLPSAADGDAMDVDVFDPQLDEAVNPAASGDAVMEDQVELPQLSPLNNSTRPAPEDVDLMSSLQDDALMAMASTQPRAATDDTSAVDHEQREPVLPAADDDEDDAAASRERAKEERRQKRAAAKESRMALQFMLDRSRDAAEATQSEAGPEPEVEVHTGVDNGEGPVPTLPGISDLLAQEDAEAATASASTSRLNGNRVAPSDERPSTATPRATAGRSSTHTTPRGTRTYTRQPKPSFFEREQETAQAFAELPTNEVAATPRRAKRRLPLDAPGDDDDENDDEEAGPSKRQRTSLQPQPRPARAPRAPRDPDAPRNPPGRKKAPETAIRSSTGYLQGQLTKTEVSQVTGAIEAFAADHNLDVFDRNEIIHANPKNPNLKDNTVHEELWSRIMDACPTRPRQKLINWCRQTFHNFVARGTWTPEQDAELREMINQYGNKWNVIGKAINRHQKDVRDRYRNYLIAGKNRRSNAWDAQEEQEFLDIVGEVLSIFQHERKRNPDSDMFRSGKSNEELVDWNVVAERMKQGRTRIQCQEKWRRMREGNKINSTVLASLVEPDQRWRLKRARHEIASMSHADMYHIVLAIPAIDGGAREDSRINWKAILENQRKKYHRYTAMLLWSRLRQLVPDQEDKNVQECAKELITMYQSDGGTFAIPGDGAFDEKEEEALLADIPPPRKRGPGKPKPGKGKGKARQQQRRSMARGAVSDEFVHDSDSDEEEGDSGESSRATHNETSLAPDDDDDNVSVDLSSPARQSDRGGSVDLGIDAAIYDEEEPAASPNPRKKTKSSKGKEREQEEPAAPPASTAKRHKKRYSGEMTLDFTPQKSMTNGRKRARGEDVADVDADAAGTPNGSVSGEGRKKKRARRVSKEVVAPVEEQEVAVASSDDDMEDIPARMPVAAM